MKAASRAKIKVPSWQQTAKLAEGFGWFAERADKNVVVLERGRQRIVAHKFSNDTWKIEYFENGKMDDMSGITDSKNARRELVEMAMRK